MEKRLYKKTGFFVSALVLALSLVISACTSNQENSDNKTLGEKINVVTTIAQIADPISVIGGDRVNVQSLMGPGIDPHLYNATQGDIQKLENGDVIFYSGLNLEANMVKVFEEIGKNKPVLAIGEAISNDKLLNDEEGATDPHVWFDIDLWKQALGTATEELKKVSKDDAAYFEANKKKYFEELDKLKKEAKEKLTQIPNEKRVLVTAHDAFGYFGRMQDIQVVGLQGLSTEDEIGLSDIDDTINTLVKYKVPAVFVESSINPASINAVIEGAKKKGLNVKLGGELYSDAMGDAGTKEGTYLGMYRHNVDTIFKALSGKGE
ncbi:zinc ABC transporter substrate-binding protein [Paenibacillus alkaliterrae]|uniref:metal ABC transporter solute-binding protein, Zn/Mn family n=1 Tax=Paenibacillus alkaliterrae TaxID=320909 RepID=UPI001F1AFCE0|nr:zinc ABC transporter substrate-binding protein [Paenibacillus alkaliterrae]MCF2938340.1 zinc ABC transporter substrate-binding protein [Paenibacillus alkaliterrae]